MGPLSLVLVVLTLTMSHGSAQITKQLPVGGDLTLELEQTPPKPITRVVWKHGVNLLADMTFGEFSYYGTFDGHTKLEANGRLTVSKIKLEEGGEYSVEVNDEPPPTRYKIVVFEVLTKPSIRVTPLACGSGSALNCVLLCELDPKPSTTVTYEWEIEGEKSKISGEELTIDKTTKANNFTCWAKNPVSEQASESIKNPFLQEPGGSGVNIGFVVGMVILALFLLGVIALILFCIWKKFFGICDCITTARSTETTELNPPGNVNSQNGGNMMEGDKNTDPAETAALNPPPDVNSQNGGNMMEGDKNTDPAETAALNPPPDVNSPNRGNGMEDYENTD